MCTVIVLLINILLNDVAVAVEVLGVLANYDGDSDASVTKQTI